jgi:hypothetical protein
MNESLQVQIQQPVSLSCASWTIWPKHDDDEPLPSLYVPWLV